MSELTIEQRMELEQARPWRPEPGDTVTGTVVRLHKRDSEYGGHLVVTLDTGEGLVAVHAFHGVIKNKLYEIKPAVGTRLSIGYQGEVASGKRKDPKTDQPIKYHNYTVIDPDAELVQSTIDWDDPDF